MVVNIDLSGRVVVVTGGNRGIGLGVCRRAAAAGADLAIIYQSSPEAVSVAEGLAKEFGVKVNAYKCDVVDQTQINETFQMIWKDFGKINGVVCNAGTNVQRPALDLDKDTFDSVMGPNVWGVFATAQAAARLWKSNGFKGGKLVLMSSVAATVAAPGAVQSPYHASKGALTMLAKALAMEWAELGITVNNVSPGLIRSDLVNGILKAYPDLEGKWLQGIMLHRIGEPEEVGNSVLFLLSDLAQYYTGSELLIDGGIAAW